MGIIIFGYHSWYQPTDALESVREKYYKDFDKLNDEFFFCKDNAEIKEILASAWNKELVKIVMQIKIWSRWWRNGREKDSGRHMWVKDHLV